MKIFIINLDNSIDRLNEQIKQFNLLGLTFERLSAVSIDDVDENFYLNHLKYGQRLIKQTEMACFLSHKKAWEKVIALNEPCVILEDDAIIVHDFKTILDTLTQKNNDFEFINLETQPRKKIISKQPAYKLNAEYDIYQLLLEKNGTGGYILYPSGAKKLLKKANHTLALADAFIYDCKGLKLHQIEPAVLLQDIICPAYNVPVYMQAVSIIGAIQNTVHIRPTVWQKLQFRKNRIITQIRLGIKTLRALCNGEKRNIKVVSQKFTTNYYKEIYENSTKC